MNFVNRTSELESLNRAWAGPEGALFVLYGRRRLGKTALLRRFAAKKPAVYHMADRSVEADAMRFMARSMSIALGEPSLEAANYPDWYSLFAAFDRLRDNSTRTVFIIDEYQYLCEIQPAFSSIIQKWWDEHWKKQNIMLVLCGSLQSMMYRETLAQSSPLYGRRTGQWLLKPLRFSDAARFFPKANPRTKMELWSLGGGVPRYLELAAPVRSFRKALSELVLDRGGPLYSETEFLLNDAVSTSNVYWSILHTIGNGATRISEIGGRLGLPSNQLTRYLAVLKDLGFVNREIPVTCGNPRNSKKGIYEISDCFLRLWFSCIAPYENLLEFGDSSEAFRQMEQRLLHHHAWAFERICRQYVENHAATLNLSAVGKYWDKNTEIDVVGVDEKKNPIFAGECKWAAKPLGMAAVEQLEAAVTKTWSASANSMKLALFSASGFSEKVEAWAKKRKALLVSAEQLCR